MAMPPTNINGNVRRRTDWFLEGGEYELALPKCIRGSYQEFKRVSGPEIETSRITTKQMIMEAMGPEEATLARRERQNQHRPFKNTRAVEGRKE